MGNAHSGYGDRYTVIRDMRWSPSEKAVARQAFDRALHREFEAVIREAAKGSPQRFSGRADGELVRPAGSENPRLLRTADLEWSRSRSRSTSRRGFDGFFPMLAASLPQQRITGERHAGVPLA